MNKEAYEYMASLEDRHWWFRGRNKIVQSLLKNYIKERNLKILDAGCGSGGNFEILKDFGEITGIEPDKETAENAKKRNIAREIKVGGLTMPGTNFADSSFDLVLMTDVLEHIEKDVEALDQVYKLLKPGGKLVLTVPANPFLWSQHDITHQHFRRYVKSELKEKLKNAGFKINILHHYNSVLFIPIALIRLVKAKLHIKEKSTDLGMPPKIINEILFAVFSAERFSVGKIKMPFGVSLLTVVTKEK